MCRFFCLFMFLRPASRRLLCAPRGPLLSRARTFLAPGAMARARVFSVPVLDGVQGVPPTAGVKPQDAKTFAPHGWGKASSTKNQVSNLLTKNYFYALSVPVPPRTPKSILKLGVFHAKNVGAWAELEDDVPVSQVSGFKSTKLLRISSGNACPRVTFDNAPRRDPAPPTSRLVSTSDSVASRLFKMCYYADEGWSDADVDAEIRRATAGMFSLSTLTELECSDDEALATEAPLLSATPAPLACPCLVTEDPLAHFEMSFAAQCAGFEALGVPWMVLKAGNRQKESRRRNRVSAEVQQESAQPCSKDGGPLAPMQPWSSALFLLRLRAGERGRRNCRLSRCRRHRPLRSLPEYGPDPGRPPPRQAVVKIVSREMV